MNGNTKNFGLLDFMKYADKQLPAPASKPTAPVTL